MSDDHQHQVNKAHHKKKTAIRAKKQKRDQFGDDLDNGKSDDEENSKKPSNGNEFDDNYRKARERNPKAFALQSYVAAERQFRRTQDIKAKRLQLPEVDRTALEPPPIFVALVGPPKVGKSTLMQNLIRNYTRQKLNNICGPVTVVTGKKRRITFYECGNDLNSMIDTAKCADLVLLMIDASFGFEMETFEFLNVCQVHGFPRIMGVLTHMDLISNNKTLKKVKKRLKHRFWTELYQGAKLFYLTGIINNEYRRNEVHNLARFISVMKFKDLGFRLNHSFVVADRMEDLTQPDQIRQNPRCERNVCLYGYVRGCPLKKNANIHIPGCGDYLISDLAFLPDPCPLPDQAKKRTLDDRERLLYAPFSGVGGLIYDKDAVYIELGGSHSHSKNRSNFDDEQTVFRSSNPLLNNLIGSKNTVDSKLDSSKLKIFSTGEAIESGGVIDKSNNGFNGDEDEENSEEDENMNSEEEEEDSENDDDEEEEEDEEEDEEDDEEEDEEDDDETGMLRWKQDLKLKASEQFERNKKVNWLRFVYESNDQDQGGSSKLQNDDDADDSFFRVKRSKAPESNPISFDNTKYLTSFHSWTTNGKEADDNTGFDSIRDCFVTGKWDRNSDAKHLLDGDNDDDDSDVWDAFDEPYEPESGDEELYGDFEDMETGEVHKAAPGTKRKSEDDDDDEDEDEDSEDEEEDGENGEKKKRNGDLKIRKKPKSEMTKRERLLEKKKRLKEQFDREFDEIKDKTNPGEIGYYEGLKNEASQQTELNRLEFEKMDDSMRVEYEGYRPGMYVRIEIKQMPCEFVTKFDPHFLAIVGCLGTNESNIGCVQVRLKKHRWYPKILKTRDPLIISLGWRRFQTLPVFFIQDHNMRNRALKYTPQHMFCHACFWGPISPQNTGFLAIQTYSNDTKNFRVAATGVVLDCNKSTHIVKKLKLVGTPLQIFKKTAFVQGMFSSIIEASKFEGATVKTVSGIRGQIKKALHSSQVPAGSVRATFEDKILASDIVFLRSWYAVDVPQFYSCVNNLLVSEVPLVKTLGELKREKGVQGRADENSIYRKVEREEKVFAPLRVGAKLEQQLPFALKHKERAQKIDPLAKQRVAVMREPEEAKTAALMKMFKKVYDNRMKEKQKAHQELLLKHKKETEKIETKRLQKSKEMKKQVYRRLGKVENRKNKHLNKDD